MIEEGIHSKDDLANIILPGSWSIKEINIIHINNGFFHKLTHLTNTSQQK